MSNNYQHKKIETKWQKYWEENNSFVTTENNEKKIYILDMFPYPSGEGLHVGHLLGYTATDVVARYKRLNGFDVLHPMGWDAFGLPAEQYALNTGNNPFYFNQKNILNFKRQIKAMGFSYDWNKEIATTDPNYYSITQEIFRLLYKHNHAFLKTALVNWCPQLGTVLSDEEVIIDENGNQISERGSFPVFQKEMKQWILKITSYADKLLEGLETINCSDSIKSLQRKWIGKTKGIIIEFEIEDQKFPVFMVESQQLEGAQAIFLNFSNQDVKNLIQKINNDFFENFKNKNIQINNKTGYSEELAFLGLATNTNLNIKLPLIIGFKEEDAYNTGFLIFNPSKQKNDALIWEKRKHFINYDAKFETEIVNLKNQNICQKTHCKTEYRYKLRDWIFSRQRYWGEPFPVLYKGDKIELDPKPVLLPLMENIKPIGDGRGPLANNRGWVNVKIGQEVWERDTNTMPNWAGSSWYHLAYILKNSDGTYENLDSQEAKRRFEKWLPIDIYVGGQEHAVLHLLYVRYWHRFLYDIGLVTTKEPFKTLINQGMILGNDGQKMSKSKGNVLNPDSLIDELGADTIRIYEMFMGPFSQTKNWSEQSILGIRKWLSKIWDICLRIIEGEVEIDPNYKQEKQQTLWHQTIKDITTLIEEFKFNIVISKFMVFFRQIGKFKKIISKSMIKDIVVMLSVFAPHFCEEILEKLGAGPIQNQNWPVFDESKIEKASLITYAIQVNGKLRATIEVSTLEKEAEIIEKAKISTNVKKYLKSDLNYKIIFIENKTINFVLSENEDATPK